MAAPEAVVEATKSAFQRAYNLSCEAHSALREATAETGAARDAYDRKQQAENKARGLAEERAQGYKDLKEFLEQNGEADFVRMCERSQR